MIPWTYTILNDFGNCPRKAFHKHIAKDLPREEWSPELKKGIEIHEALEAAINEGRSYADTSYGKHIEPLIDRGAEAEVKLAMTIAGKPASFWGRGDEAPWGRGKLDALVMYDSMAAIVDWKTGKPRENKFELECQSVLLKANYPNIKTIFGSYVWLAEDRVGPVYDLSDTRRAYAAIVQATNDMHVCEQTSNWPEKPNALCSWCPVKKCKFNRSE